MQFWTNSTWHSPLHRVIRRGEQTPDTASDLVSIVMFAGKDEDTTMGKLKRI